MSDSTGLMIPTGQVSSPSLPSVPGLCTQRRYTQGNTMSKQAWLFSAEANLNRWRPDWESGEVGSLNQPQGQDTDPCLTERQNYRFCRKAEEEQRVRSQRRSAYTRMVNAAMDKAPINTDDLIHVFSAGVNSK